MKKLLNIDLIFGLLELAFCGHFIAVRNYPLGGAALIVAGTFFMNFYLDLKKGKNKKGS